MTLKSQNNSIFCKNLLIQNVAHQCVLLEDVPIQIWYLKSPRKYGFTNEAHAKFLGKSFLEIYNCDIYDVLTKEDADNYYKSNLQVFDSKKISTTNKWLTGKNGIRKYLNIIKTPKLDKNGNIEYVVCTAIDNTEQKEIEEDLKNTKQSYYDILNSVSDAIYILDKTNTIIAVNKGAEKMYGCKEDELIGMKTEDSSVPGKNDIDKVNEIFSEVYKTGKTQKIHFWSQRKNGEEFLKSIMVNRGLYFGSRSLILTARDITESYKRSESLKNAEEKYRNIVENTNDMIVFLDIEGNIRFVNDGQHKRLGYEIGEILGVSFAKFAPASEIPLLAQKIQCALNNEFVDKYQSKLIHNDGYEVDVEIFGRAIQYQGETTIQCTIRDISLQKKAEKDIQYQFELRKIIMDLASTFINIPLNKTEYAINNALKTIANFVGADRSYIFKYDIERHTADNTNEYCKPGVRPQIGLLRNIPFNTFREWVRKNLLGQNVEIKDVSNYPDEITKRSLEAQDIKSLFSVPLMDNNKCIGFIGFDFVKNPHVFTDDEKEMIKVFAQMLVNVQTRTKAEENKAKLLMAIEQNPTSIVITNKEGIIEYSNPITTVTTGYTQEELIGKKCSIFRSGKQDNQFYENLWNTILDRKTWRGEMLNKKKNGELIWENTVISPIFKEDNEISHFVSVKEDITERKAIIRELELAKEHAEESDKLKSAFLANMSHEIRSPLNGIIGFSSFLSEDPYVSPEDIMRYANIITNSGNHLLNIINDIIYIAKFDSGFIKPSMEPVCVTKLLKELHQIYEERIQEDKKDIKITLDIPEKHLHINTDETRLRQILENLLSNALKFTSEGSINFGFKIKNQYLEFFVKDTGIGILHNKQTDIFERFVQANYNTEKLYGGTGLGLSITRACVEILGGKIWLKSTPQIGSEFYFNIGHSPCDNDDFENSEKIVLAEHFNFEHILVAEDDETSFTYMKEILESLELKVTRASTGVEAVDKAIELSDISLVLMDIQMPLMNGLDATHEIIKEKPNLPIIAQTAYAFENEKDKCKKAGCIDYISKPINKKKLVNMLRTYLSKHNDEHTV